MFLQLYSGGWVETAARNPEVFTILAPERLQRECYWNPLWDFLAWDTTLYGYPRFRLALIDSRYQLAGSTDVLFRDEHGNPTVCKQAEVLIPRYHVPDHYIGNYALEMWRPAAWYFDNGYADAGAVKHDGCNSVRLREPVWERGGWDAIENGLGTPLAITRNSPPDMVRFLMFELHRLFDQQRKFSICKPKQKGQVEAYYEQHEEQKQTMLDRLQHPGTTIHDTMVSLAGVDC